MAFFVPNALAHVQVCLHSFGMGTTTQTADWWCAECGDHGNEGDPARHYVCPGSLDRPYDGRAHDIRYSRAYLAREAERRRQYRGAALDLLWRGVEVSDAV